MQIPFTSTPEFHPGFQRIRLLADPLLKKCIALFIGVALLTLIFCVKYREKQAQEAVYIITNLAFSIPFVIFMAGGAPLRAWLIYAGFAVASGFATVPVFLGGPAEYTLLSIPALALLYAFHRSAPNVLGELGYTEKPQPLLEAASALIACSVFILMTYYTMKETRGAHFTYRGAGLTAAYAFNCLLNYGLFYGVLYGMLSRRLLKKKIDLYLTIIINVILMFLTWVPLIALDKAPAEAAAGTFAFCLVSQAVLSMAFYFCRSSRMVFFAYLIYYLFYKSMNL